MPLLKVIKESGLIGFIMVLAGAFIMFSSTITSDILPTLPNPILGDFIIIIGILIITLS